MRSIEHGNLMDAESAQMMVEKNAFYVPTLCVYGLVTNEGRNGLDAYTIEKLEIVGYKGLEALEMAYQRGVKIGSGNLIKVANQRAF